MQTKEIHTLHLFPILDQLLIDVLENLSTTDWQQQTIAKKWKVKDVAAHLLDGNIRGISILRDGHMKAPDQPINSYADLVGFLNNLNADWVRAFERVSPQALTELLRSTGTDFIAALNKLDLHADAIFSVAWAGESASRNWFHIAREYTEKFIHQMQIRDALDLKGPLFDSTLFDPFIATFIRALPHTFRNVQAQEKTVIQINIGSDADKIWYLIRFNGDWVLDTETLFEPAATVSIPEDTAWKLFSKGITAKEAGRSVSIDGDKELGAVVLNMVSIMG